MVFSFSGRKRGVFFLWWILSVAAWAQQALPPWNSDAQKAWWTQNPAPAQWPQAARELQAQLEADYKQNGTAVFSQPDFVGWLDHLSWVQTGIDCPQVVSDPQNLDSFVVLGKDETISHLFVEKIVPLNDRKAALLNLITLQQAAPDDLHEYAAMGVAFALVFDRPFWKYWPHPQVKQEAVPIGDLNVVDRFKFYVQSNRDKKLELDPTQLSFDNLKYMVDSEVTLAELTYAQTSHISLSNMADAFFSITYDKARVTPENQLFDWDKPTYTLKEIEKDGGICVDQDYHAVMIGKAKGIPTIFFHGQGTDGGHAWFGYLQRDGTWEMNCARYASQNYLKGYARDPQTWQEVKDTTLEQVAKTAGDTANFKQARIALAWARLHEGTPVFKDLLEQARSIMPEMAETWQAEGDFLDKSNASINDEKAFYGAWITQFSSFSDMKVEGQQRLLDALKKANDPGADDLQRSIVLQNRSSGVDLGVEGSSSVVTDKLKAHDWTGAKLDFEKAVRDFTDQGGGTFFYDVVVRYVQQCLEYGQIGQAEDGLHFTGERIPHDPSSIVGIDFKKLEDKIQVSKDATSKMEAWLGEIDDGKADQAWSEGTETFQGLVPSDKWASDIGGSRQKMGHLVSRTLTGLKFHSQYRGSNGKTIDGLFVEATYATVFDSEPSAIEKVCFLKSSAGTWQAFTYDCGKA